MRPLYESPSSVPVGHRAKTHTSAGNKMSRNTSCSSSRFLHSPAFPRSFIYIRYTHFRRNSSVPAEVVWTIMAEQPLSHSDSFSRSQIRALLDFWRWCQFGWSQSASRKSTNRKTAAKYIKIYSHLVEYIITIVVYHLKRNFVLILFNAYCNIFIWFFSLQIRKVYPFGFRYATELIYEVEPFITDAICILILLVSIY